jgi:hypothetical protein
MKLKYQQVEGRVYCRGMGRLNIGQGQVQKTLNEQIGVLELPKERF